MSTRLDLTILGISALTLFNANLILAQGNQTQSDAPAATALRAYLDKDCGVIEKGKKPPLQRLLEFKSDVAVRQALADIAEKGRADLIPPDKTRPDLKPAEGMRRQLEREWDKYVGKPVSQFTMKKQGTQDGPIFNREAYINLRLAELQEARRKKATVALNIFHKSINQGISEAPIRKAPGKPWTTLEKRAIEKKQNNPETKRMIDSQKDAQQKRIIDSQRAARKFSSKTPHVR
jgi:hypothetical protein